MDADGKVVKTVSVDCKSTCVGEKIPAVYSDKREWSRPKLCSHDVLKESGCKDFTIRFTGTVHVLPNGDCGTKAKCVTNVAPSPGT